MLKEKVFEIEINDNIMESKLIKELINKKLEDISKLQAEVDEVQSKCKHNKVIVKNVSDSVFSLRLVCETCSKVIGYPSSNDLKEAGY
jgi:hypothetical protein